MIERCRPLLGTYVTIRIDGLEEAQAHAAIDRGFAEVARIHSLMSFHEVVSDVSRLNRLAAQDAVSVDPATLAVLKQALDLSEATGGAFDICVGGDLALRGLLPRPEGAEEPNPAANWRDICLAGDGSVRFAKPLWIDLGGIAKGYAVDTAVGAIAAGVEVQVVVNAGGDLAVWGPDAEAIELGMQMTDKAALVRIDNGCLASSTGAAEWGATVGSHLDGRSREAMGQQAFVAVAAPHCMLADALTKAVMALGEGAAPLLRQYGATAYRYDLEAGWHILGGDGE